VLIVNSPNNPTGRVLRRGELEVIAAFAQEHDLLVLSDEIYEHLVYDEHTHTSLAALPGLAPRTLTVNGFSKSWAMTGWRLGYVAGPAELLKPVKLLHAHMVTCAASFTQSGGLAALKGPREPLHAMVAAWSRRRSLLTRGLNALTGLSCALPEGAFYAFVDVRGSGLDGVTFASRLLDTVKVAVTPGEAFGAAGAGHVRLSYATSDAELLRALLRIETFMRSTPGVTT
jgi:aspartate aminotransferase